MKKTFVDPKTFEPLSNSEYEALKAWENIEPDRPRSFNFYLWSISKGLPPSKFGQFTSEIKQDKSIINPGAIFNKKVRDYFSKRKKERGEAV